VLSKTILVCLLALAMQPAAACLGRGEESTIFFKNVPAQAKYEIAAMVKIDRIEAFKNSPIEMATAVVVKVLTGKVRVGERLKIRYAVSSCGPNHGKGASGLVLLERSSKDKNVFLPYSRRFRDNRIEMPKQGVF
jgi:uncharacterized membrane protein YciS (DUF1049 family)